MKEDQNNLPNENLEDKIDFVKKDYTIKILVSFLIIGLVAFFVILFFLNKNIDADKFKNELNNEITKVILRNTENDQNNSKILFNGEIKLKFFPLPHIVLHDVSGRDLLQSNYKLDFGIKRINLYISLKNILRNKLTIRKSEIVDGDFTIFELKNRNKNKIIEKLFEEFLSQNSSMVLVSKNNNLTVNSAYSKREFSNMNLNFILTKNRINATGNLRSNKQPLKVDLKFTKSKKSEVELNAKLSSLAFTGDFDLSGNTETHEFSGKTKFHVDNLQIFSRTLFSQSSFIYRRVIDNSNLQLSSSFSLQNDVLKIDNIVLNGTHLNANGSMLFNFNENQKNEINFNITNIDVDSLITKNFNSEQLANEKEITIFGENNEVKDNIANNKYKTVLQEKLNINPMFFNLKSANMLLNGNTLRNIELNFSLIQDTGFNFVNIKSELPGNTNLSVIQDKIAITGKDLGEFSSFLRNIKYTNTDKESKNNEFSFNGDFSIQNNKLLINNSDFKSQYLNSQNAIEIKFNSGIVFMAVKAQIESLRLENFIQENPDKTQLSNMLKNKILFLNNFNLNTFIKLNIEKIAFKDFETANSSFMVKTSQGILSLYNINLNDKIKGDIYFNIIARQPNLNINLKLNEISFNKNINFSKLIFDLPSLDDFYGNIIISGNNLTFKKQPINSLNFNSSITNGVINIKEFNIDGFGGKCSASGFLDMQFNRKLNITLNGCTADVKNILEPVGNISNISGLVGFSSILYGEGQNISLFNRSWIFKAQLIGSGTMVDNYGLTKLNSNLFDIQKDEKLLKDLKPNEVLFNKENRTVFESLSGNIQHTIAHGGQFNFDISRPFINGKLVGNFNFLDNTINIDMDANFILLSGTLQNTIPLTLLSKIIGKTPDGLNIATNFQQIDEYIKTTIEFFNNQDNAE